MLFRFVAIFLTVVDICMIGQTGIFGPISAQVRAGDSAPNIEFTKVFSAGGSAAWNPASLSKQITVLVFYPDTSHNLQSVLRWNAVVESFANKPVQFIWITGEKESSLLPWLREHPIKGWVFHDPDGATGRAYGMERPAAVLIGKDRRIIGFDRAFVPTERTLNAALEDRITTARLEPGGLAVVRAFIESNKVRLEADSPRMPREDDHKPNFPPSFELHVSPASAEGGNFGGTNFWSFQRFDLKAIISELYGINPIRIQLPASLDDGKSYDFAMVLPEPESKETIYARFRKGLEEHLRVKFVREERVLDVYVVTGSGAPPLSAKNPEKEAHAFGGRDTTTSVRYRVVKMNGKDETTELPKALGLADIVGISMDGTLDDFCRTLERELDRPVVNETNLTGEFEFRVPDKKGIDNDFLQRLRDQLNLNISLAPRPVQLLVAYPSGTAQSPRR